MHTFVNKIFSGPFFHSLRARGKGRRTLKQTGRHRSAHYNEKRKLNLSKALILLFTSCFHRCFYETNSCDVSSGTSMRSYVQIQVFTYRMMEFARLLDKLIVMERLVSLINKASWQFSIFLHFIRICRVARSTLSLSLRITCVAMNMTAIYSSRQHMSLEKNLRRNEITISLL